MVDIFEKDIDLPWYPDEIIGRPGELKSQRLQTMKLVKNQRTHKKISKTWMFLMHYALKVPKSAANYFCDNSMSWKFDVYNKYLHAMIDD